jgi:hypothetical protein
VRQVGPEVVGPRAVSALARPGGAARVGRWVAFAARIVVAAARRVGPRVVRPGTPAVVTRAHAAARARHGLAHAAGELVAAPGRVSPRVVGAVAAVAIAGLGVTTADFLFTTTVARLSARHGGKDVEGPWA